ncbi:MAG TPA: ABC transporter substrate-binding protein, partial [Bacteroidia bacterium]
ADAGYVVDNIFQSLLRIDFVTLKVVPVLAEERPLVETTPNNGLRISYTIRKEAQWDNGKPITAKDVEFTLKVIKNPLVKNESSKPYYDFITGFEFDKKDPRKFTLICNSIYILAETSSGDYGILPSYVYDPRGWMNDFTVEQLSSHDPSLVINKKIISFANDFNSEFRGRDPKLISGSGPYKLAEWKTGEHIRLEKKKNWWGENLHGTNCFFDAYPGTIVYQVINDAISAQVASKAGNIDVMFGIKTDDFMALQKSETAMKRLNFFTPISFSYSYLGINTKLPKFSSKKTRQALAYLTDAKGMLKYLMNGFGQRIVGPIHPSDTLNYNNELEPYDFSIEKAKEFLSKDGWSDSNGDGIIDKMINGKREEFTIRFTVNAGNDLRKMTALAFQEDALKVGIKVDVVLQDWSVYLEKEKHHDFELYFGAWISAPVPYDPMQIYHTSSANGGSNYTSFGDPASDSLIECIRKELDEKKRAVLYKRLQEILYDEVPYIYLWAPVERIVVNRKFEHPLISSERPGFWPASFH